MRSNEFSQGWISNNPVTVQMLGLCPLLAVSTSVINAMAMALTTGLCLVVSAALAAAIAPYVSRQIRIAVYVALIALCVTAADIILQAKLPLLHQQLGLFIPLIVTNCIILGRIEAHAAANSVYRAVVNAAGMSAGFALVIVILGALREIVGQAQLFGDAAALLGDFAKPWALHFDQPPLLLATLPAGAFILLGFIVAGFNLLAQKGAPSGEVSPPATGAQAPPANDH